MRTNIKVLMFHNYYQISGGEDKVFRNEIDLLEENGYEVVTYELSNDFLKETNFFKKIILGIENIWSYPQFKKIKKCLEENKPDIAHFHNFFPLITPSAYYACQSENVPVVQTLHNYRLLCPAATFLRNGEVCEKCLTGSISNSIKHGCYRGSSVNTMPVAAMIETNKLLNTWNSKVNRYIALTEFAKGKFIQGGIKEDKIIVKPNFMDKNEIPVQHVRDNSFVFVGRISQEKGLDILLEAWKGSQAKKDANLYIIGDGPDRQKLEKYYAGKDNIVFLGRKDEKEVLRYVSKAKYLVVPSVWYEGFPMTIIESYSLGTPVIASNIGSLNEVVQDEITGFHFKCKSVESLTQALDRAYKYRYHDSLVSNTKLLYDQNYTPRVNFETLDELYRTVVKEVRDVKN